MTQLIYVFVGGGLGSICRYLISRYDWTEGLPYGTLVANVVSSFILGVLLGLSLQEILRHPHRLLLMTGFCGGFSTFSTFSAEIVELYMDGQLAAAAMYAVISVLAGLIAIGIGMYVAKAFV